MQPIISKDLTPISAYDSGFAYHIKRFATLVHSISLTNQIVLFINHSLSVYIFFLFIFRLDVKRVSSAYA